MNRRGVRTAAGLLALVAPVTYAAYSGEAPVFSGGRAIRGFRPS